MSSSKGHLAEEPVSSTARQSTLVKLSKVDACHPSRVDPPASSIHSGIIRTMV